MSLVGKSLVCGVKKMEKAVLVLGKGDTPHSDRNRARFVDFVKKAGIEVKQSDYHEIAKLGTFRNETINVMFYFPYTFWNANCEKQNDAQLYGTSRAAYEKFRSYFLSVQAELEQKFNGQQLKYIIPPEKAAVDRDKVETVRVLRQGGVPTPESVPYNSLDDITGSVNMERGVYIKCRYGAEGKGITVLHQDKWLTNYKVEGGRLANHDDGLWQFADITGRKDLLKQLLQNDVIVEREILTPRVLDGKKFDMRLYVINQKVPHLFVRLNDPIAEVTNVSRGGGVRHHPNTGLTEDCLLLANQNAKLAAQAMGLPFVGVDIMFDGNLTNAKVIEVQAFADFSGFPKFTRFDLVRYMASDSSGLLV